MSHIDTLKSLESTLASFLDQAIRLKENRLQVLDGINRLDDIALGFLDGDDLTDKIGGWFAEHNRWLENDMLRPVDQSRIGEILGQLRRELRTLEDSSPAARKIGGEIDRWTERASRQKLVLKRGPEEADSTETCDTITLFNNTFSRMAAIFADFSGSGKHLLSVLDQALKAASLQKSREALLLSALIIYYLKQDSYKVEPYIRRLKEAEDLQRGSN